jgi:type I restriction enzyme M protein
MVSRTNRELSAEDIGRIADTYRAWRGEDADLKPYGDVPGLCAAADLDAIRDHNHVLIPGQCIGSEPVEAMGNRWTRRSLG